MVVSLMAGSLTLTRNRRSPAAARGSSRVLMSGLDRGATDDRPFPVRPAGRLRQYTTPRGARTTAVAFLAQAPAGLCEQPFQEPLARLVMHDQVRHAAALRRRVPGAAGRLQVQPATVPEQHAGDLAPGRDRAEQAAPRLLRGQLPLPASGEDDAVLVPEPEDARVHKAETKRAAPRRLPVRHWPQASYTRNTADDK
jgi:hypothetical protein